jgi:hypothetical protein
MKPQTPGQPLALQGTSDRQRRRQRIRRYMASRVIDLVSRCPELDELARSSISHLLELSFEDAVEFLAHQRGYDSLEAAYHHLAFEPEDGDEDFQTASLNIEFERLRLAAIANGQPIYDAILLHLRAFETPRFDLQHDQNDET